MTAEAARYPRDMAGYGPTPPDPRWPGGARIALQFVVNFEEGGENNILHGDAASEAFLSEIVGAAPWPGQRHWNMESIYEYGARAGFWRLFRLFSSAQVPVTVYGVAEALARCPEQVEAMQVAGWEIASHGLKWIEYKDYTEAQERAHMEEAIKLHTEVTGERPRGWYTGRTSMNSVQLAAEEGGFAYIADSYADDLPYWIRVGDADQLIIPYTLDANDMRFATPQGFNSGEQFFTYLKDSFDALYREGIEGSPKMMSVGLHCRLAGRPGRIEALRRFIEYVDRHEKVWLARREDIARHWVENHPPLRFDRPSEMSKARFVRRFGSIFEHSEWVAERAYELELGPAHDSAAGMFSAMVRAFRAATTEEKLAVLRAHPDLAGRIEAATPLTDASASEQAAAGLDALNSNEQEEFLELNRQYMETFGFPFIIAVRDYTKYGILDQFRDRLANDVATEFAEACAQVERIARLRIEDYFETLI